MKIPQVTTARLLLRPFDDSDAKPLHALVSVEGMLQYFPGPGQPTLEQVQRLIERQILHWQEHGLGWWGVELIDEGELLGWNGLQYLPETEEVEVGYLLAKPYWNKGLATEGARAALRFGFDELQLEQIVGIVHPENKASERVLEKLGMRFTEQTEYFDMQVFRYEIDRSEFAPEG
jgi:ribosomal-protein-alanine N-acetyltransferase